jgi:hypothetical protein
VRLEPVVLQEFDEPAPAERGLERHRRPRGQVADQPEHRLGPVNYILAEFDRAVPIDHRYLRALAMDVDTYVDRHGRVLLFPSSFFHPERRATGLSWEGDPALIGSCE